MRNRSASTIFRVIVVGLVAGLIGFHLVAFAQDRTCQQLGVKLDIHKRQLMEFADLRKELDRKYESYVKADFIAQTDGILDQLHRSRAVKVVFARNRLDKSISQKEVEMASVRQEYCDKCQAEFNSPLSRIAYCEKCEFKPECARRPASR